MVQPNPIGNLIPTYLRNSTTFTVVVTDLEGLYIYVSPLFQSRFSFITDDFIGKPYTITVHPDDIEKCRQASYQCITQPDKIVNLQIRKSEAFASAYFLTNWEFSLLKDLEGEPVGILCIGHDISETERASRIARVYARRVSSILRNITDAYFTVDNHLIIKTVNRSFEKIIGIKKAQAVGMNIWDIVEKDKDYTAQAFEKALKEKVATHFEDYVKRLDKWFFISVYPSPQGLTILFQDITEMKMTDERLKHSEYKLKAMMNSKDEVKILLDKNYNILFFNKLAENFAIEFENKPLVIGSNILEYINSTYTKNFKEGLRRAFEGNKSEKEQEIKFSDGSTLWFKRTFNPVYNEENEVIGVALYMLNITAQKQTDRKMEKQLEALREVAFIQSHVMRSPVASILGLINLFDKDKLDAENKELMEYLEMATKQLDKVIHEVVKKVNDAEAFE